MALVYAFHFLLHVGPIAVRFFAVVHFDGSWCDDSLAIQRRDGDPVSVLSCRLDDEQMRFPVLLVPLPLFQLGGLPYANNGIGTEGYSARNDEQQKGVFHQRSL